MKTQTKKARNPNEVDERVGGILSQERWHRRFRICFCFVFEMQAKAKPETQCLRLVTRYPAISVFILKLLFFTGLQVLAIPWLFLLKLLYVSFIHLLYSFLIYLYELLNLGSVRIRVSDTIM
ncbi:hypothetical protein V6N13_145541 [Hibiscus sabdariffa]|uniref:Uncharacterized protein n=2 Tax=Hibiscus sabdariffa TaxID=183260 RepID=A0ABR2TPX4_9ROSI